MPFSIVSAEDTFPAPASVTTDKSLVCALDPLLAMPGNWELTPERLESLFPAPDALESNPYFSWLTKDRSRARFARRLFTNLTVDLTLLEGTLPVEEAVVDFVDGKVNGITFSLFNRGDSGAISQSEFARRLALADGTLRDLTGVVPQPLRPEPAHGRLAEGWTWISLKGMAALEHNPDGSRIQPEYLRIRIAPRTAKGAIAASMRGRGSGIKLSDLKGNVQKNAEGDVWISGIPMVDQGDKGYCVVATVQRLLEYYGISCDQHQLAQIVGAEAETGTNSLRMTEELKRIDHTFKTNFKNLVAMYSDGMLRLTRNQQPVKARDMARLVQGHVDQGIPLLWGLEVGLFPEEPEISMQDSGGHMRLLIGYNTKTNHLLFSDTWGAGHEKKRMKADHAYKATHGLYLVQPTLR